MELREIRTRVEAIETQLGCAPFVELASFRREEGALRIALTDRFRRQAERAGVWCSDGMLKNLLQAGHGLRKDRMRSLGGDDGIFVLDRNFRPENVMMRRIFGEFLDRRPAELESILGRLGCSLDHLKAVRVVSHHLRLLGIVAACDLDEWLILVDVDPTKIAA